MAELYISHQGKKYFSATVRTERFAIGRSQENDLVLTGDGVSRRHARIEKRGDVYWLTDESAQGTFLNGKKLAGAEELKSRDRIGVDSWSIEFFERVDRACASPVPTGGREPVTNVIPDAEIGGGSVSDTMPNILIVRDPRGAHARYPVRKKSILIGSAAECDVVIDDACVSRRHAVLALTGRGFNVSDLDSTNGTFIDGARIREAFLNGDREIGIGRSCVQVCFKKPNGDSGAEAQEGTFFGIVGESLAMREMRMRLVKIAATDMTALILGPSGSGKERAAYALHRLSKRRDKAFVAINCGAIAPGLIESELLGHEKGAFTGAAERHAGAFEQAHAGTLFLDEVGELPLSAQARLLRVIECGKVRRLGAERDTDIDVRVVAATHRNLPELVARGEFREDLFYRLYVLPLEVPPLTDRDDDAVLLARHFLNLGGRPGSGFESCAIEKIRAYDWPGNVRELRNAVLRALVLAETNRIRAADLVLVSPVRAAFRDGGGVKNNPVLTPAEQAEAERIREALRRTENDKNVAAKMLNMGRSTLFRRIKVLGI